MFEGFQAATIQFIRDLSTNNRKDWFDANRSRYEDHYLEPAKQFVDALAAPLGGLRGELNAEPRVNGSIFRINRDIRFSKDKTPYKDHLDLWFWEGDRKQAVSGLFFRLTGDKLYLGAGCHKFDKPVLERFRKAVCEPSTGNQLVQIEQGLRKAGLAIDGERYAKTPKGFDPASSELEALVRLKAATACHIMDHPPELNTPAFVEFCIDKWRDVLALHRWLIDMAKG